MWKGLILEIIGKGNKQSSQGWGGGAGVKTLHTLFNIHELKSLPKVMKVLWSLDAWYIIKIDISIIFKYVKSNVRHCKKRVGSHRYDKKKYE